MTPNPVKISPFRVDVEQSILDDLKQRLGKVRFADDVDPGNWDYGTDAGYLRELVDYWREEFDWRAQERALNDTSQFIADIDGVRMHYAHERGESDNPVPIVLTHGWPSGYLEMTKLIPLLTHPSRHGGDAADAFDVIVPSLPGFGFSGPQPRGFGYYAAAQTIHRLMTDGLGYANYGLHSTGAGAFVNGWIALEHPSSIVGYHTHSPTLMPVASFDPPAPPASDEESTYQQRSAQWGAQEGAYALLHRTKPQTLSHALADSPAGLASWLVEKHRTWSDCDGDVEQRYTKDELLTSFTIYWVTNTIGSSIRAYYERVHNDPQVEPGRRFDGVPTGVAMPRKGLPGAQTPRVTADRIHDVRHWVPLASGGHFASWEEPSLVANSLQTFFGALRGAGATDGAEPQSR